VVKQDSSSSAPADDETVAAFAAVCAGALAVFTNLRTRQPFNTSTLSRLMWVAELLHGNQQRMRNSLGISPYVFQQLVAALRLHAGLADSKYVAAEVQLAMFLYTCRMAASTHDVEERFQHSTTTVSK